MAKAIRSYAQSAVRALASRTEEEREKRAAHAFALLLVSIIAIVRYVSGVTVPDTRFTLYALAVAVSAARGGFAPAVVATLASIVVAGRGPSPSSMLQARLLFGLEGVCIAFAVSVVRSRLLESRATLGMADTRIAELTGRDRHRRLLDAALRHLEDAAGETAVVVLDERGIIIEWRGSAERMYGHAKDDALGRPLTSLLAAPPSTGELSALLRRSVADGSVLRPDVHRRRDGLHMHVEMEIKPFRNGETRGFTLAVHDLARTRAWDDYRDAATRVQADLQQAADDTRQQLAALESLIDPSLNPLGGPAMVIELLERLRATVGADGAALVHPGRTGDPMVAAGGLQPVAASRRNAAAALRLAPGRVAIVHNDPAQVERLSALDWPSDVTSLMIVPVVYDGRVWSTVEVASARSRRATDWDVALVRVVADRLAAVVVQTRGLTTNPS